jgi:hypothetical protein
MVKRHVPFFVPPQVFFPGVMTGAPQHFVVVGSAFANGVTITGTQIDAD